MKRKLITALDFDNMKDTMKMVDTLGNSVEFYKVGLELFLNTHGTILQYLADKDKRIFLDLKFHDIPNTVKAAAKFAAGLPSVSMFNVHASGGHQMIAEAAAAARQDQILLAVTALTSLDTEDVKELFDSNLDVSSLALNLAKQAKDAGAKGVVCSALEAKKIKETCGSNFVTVCPGIRFAEGGAGDQKRIMSPNEALKKGADFLVAGRPITGADDPKGAAERMLNEMAGH